MRLRLAILTGALLACDTADPPADGGPPGSAATDTAVAADRPVVVFLGTSLTSGLGLRSPGDRWPERLGRRADSAGRPVEIVNAGVSGDTSAGGLRRLDWALDRGRVDVLVVELGANDGLRGQSPSALEDNLRTIVERARERHPDVSIVLVGMEAPANLGPDYTRRFRSVFPRVAGSMEVALVPFLLDGVAGIDSLNQPDGIHPTAAGNRIMAETVWPVLDSVLVAREEAR